MRGVIMQPTYLPWPGYFDLLDQSDVFVFLDTVAFDTRSWQQRNRIKTAQGAVWLTVPVRRVSQETPLLISDVTIADDTDWQTKHWRTLEHAYRRAPYFADYAPDLQALLCRDWCRLADLNIALIEAICGWLGLHPNLRQASELPPVAEQKGAKLLTLCRHIGATEYLSPAGAADYLHDDTTFRDAGIALHFQNYEPPTYPQQYGEFVPYLSVLDLLFSQGADSLAVIRSGRRENLP